MKIAIVGSKPDTWEECKKLDRRSWKIWRFSRKNYDKPPKADLWFELHHPRNYDRYETHKPGYKDFVQKGMTWDEFPFGELVDEFGPYFFHYGQAPWIIAYAITKKPQEIMLFGMEPGTEYGEQKKEIQHFMCIAQERGIKISAPEDPALSTYAPLYAVEADWRGQDQWLAKLREKGIEPTTADQRQTSFTSDNPRKKLVAEMIARKEARLLKYGK
jgi:hypothetical protein